MPDHAQQLATLAALIDDLCDPHLNVERIYDTDQHRNKRVRRIWETTQPGLLAQLAQSVQLAGQQPEGALGGTFRSKPPLQIEALSRYLSIQVGAVRWAWSLRQDIRDTPESQLRGLIGPASTLDDPTLTVLIAEVRQWRRWCAVMTAWESPAYAPHVPCPLCEKVGQIRVNLTARTAVCLSCEAGWDPDTIGVLAEHVRRQRELVA
jgi:hypothetical protein